MHLLISILLLGSGTCEGVYLQMLTCPHNTEEKTLPKVWCKQNTTQCCTGLTFSHQNQSFDGDKLKLTQGSDSFTVAVLEPPYGEGIYWCGVLSDDGTIIKLAEGYFHSSFEAYVWSVARWVLLPLLPAVTILISFYHTTTMKYINKKKEDINFSSVLEATDPQYDAAEEPVYELE